MIAIEPHFPWHDGEEDRLFKRLIIIFLFLFLLLGITLNSLTLPEIEQKKLIDVSPRLAKLILEKKKRPPPPVKKLVKKEEPEKKVDKKDKKKKLDPKPKKKDKVKVKAKVKPKPNKNTRQAAKKTAQKSGLMAFSDDLADLRSFDFSDVSDTPQLKTGKQAVSVISANKLLTAKATTGSGGIKSSSKGRSIQGSKMGQRATSSVKSSIQSGSKIASKVNQQKSRRASRSQEEIERVFQKNKGAIFSIYNRELRKDPSLQGKVVIELTIAPNGNVTKCVIISSELGHKKLEKRLVSKIKKFKFASKKVPVFIVRYPIDFLPS